MANSLSSLTAGVGGVQISSVDTSGSLDIKSGTTTIVSITSAGAAVTGTLSSTSGTTIQGLTVVGLGSGLITTNTALGISALLANTTGYSNTALGWNALIANTTGFRNTAVGKQALGALTTGDSNTAIGEFALLTATTAQYNTAVGQSALRSNTTASNNTAVGYQAGYSNTTGTQNTYLGQGTGYSNSTSSNNLYVGTAAGFYLLGSNNTAIGLAAGQGVTGGASTGSNNTFIGNVAGYGITTGSYNTFVGVRKSTNIGCGENITTGSKNTIIGGYDGNQGGLDIRTLSNYVVLSDGDGQPTAIWDTRRNQLSSSYYAGAVSTAYYSPRGVASMSDNGGSGITSSNIFGGNPSTGFLHVNEVGTSKYLIAAIFKQNSTLAPVITVIASSGLSVSATNPGGTVLIGGATTGANVKMRYIAYDGQYSL
jgi:hypothetical protein